MLRTVKHLDPLADNAFGYDKDAGMYTLVQTRHAKVHKVGAPKDEFEVVYWRSGVKYESEPTDDDFKKFEAESRAAFEAHMENGEWHTDMDEHGEPITWRFDSWELINYKGETTNG